MNEAFRMVLGTGSLKRSDSNERVVRELDIARGEEENRREVNQKKKEENGRGC